MLAAWGPRHSRWQIDCTELEARVSSHSRWLAELEREVIVLQVAGN